jgi:cyclophilin family peptidyl-prolyl cis-trans isomerase
MAAADDFTVQFVIQIDATRREDVLITVREAKAPIGAQRFRELVAAGFYNGCALYRVVPGFILQFGLSSNVSVQRHWDAMPISDDVLIELPDWNIRGSVAFYTAGPSSRTTEVIINYDDNHQLDDTGFVPFGRVVKGMPALSTVYSGYRERPLASAIRLRGGAYLQTEFPHLSYIVSARQVAFVEEPVVLSKNFTGLLITGGMVLAAILCCACTRAASRRIGPLIAKGQGYSKPERGDSAGLAAEDFDDDSPRTSPK